MIKQNNTTKEPSLFLQAAVALDDELSLLDRVTNDIGALNLTTEKGMKRSLLLLDQFNEIRERIAAKMSRLGETLENVSSNIGDSSNRVNERAAAIQERHQQADELFQRFRILGENIGKVAGNAAEIGQEIAALHPKEDKVAVACKLIDQLTALASEASQLKEDASRANLKILEQNAHMLRQKVLSANKRLLALSPSH